MMKEHNIAIVLAAGRGSRMGSKVQKQYLMMREHPVLYYSLKVFQEFDGIQEIILVTGKEEIAFCRDTIVNAYGFDKVSKIVAGGTERYLSVYRGLLAAEHCDYVFIHDGARPFINEEILQRILEQVRETKACVVGMPVKDTIKVADQNCFAAETPDRKTLWQVQTPQVFAYSLVKESYDQLLQKQIDNVTDDAMVVERMGNVPVKLVEGSYRNIKITTPEDLLIAEAFL